MLALASCQPDAPREDPVPTPSQEEPTTGGTVTVGVLGEPPALDPYSKLASDLTYALARPVYRSLFRIDPDGVVRSDLVEIGDATSVESVANGVIVSLEPARWSDGTPVTTGDVVRSVRRAREPSGFVGLKARAVGRRRVRISGDTVGDWTRRLALGTFVVPRRRGLELGSGPFVATRYVPGLEIVLEPNPRWEGEEPRLDRVVVQFVSSTQVMVELLARGRLDAAAVPSAINLDDRLDELGIAFEETPGWETIVLDLAGMSDRDLRANVIAAVDRDDIGEGLIRDEGRPSASKAPDVPPVGSGTEILLGTASGDELLQLMQRILQRQMARREIKAELVQIDPATLYGEWEGSSPLDVALRREIAPGFGGPKVPKDLSWFPLFSVHSFLAYGDRLKGIEANGSLDGPLWNAHEWWLE